MQGSTAVAAALFFYVIGNFVPNYTKTFRGDVQLAVRYIMLCIPLGRKCAASAHFVFRKKERHRKTRQNQFMILPGFVTAETAGFEPACPGGLTHFECAPL